MLAWLAYALVVSSLAGAAAAAAERVLRLYDFPGRYAWAAAMLASAGLPVAVWLGGGPPGAVPALPALRVGEAVARIGGSVGAGPGGGGWWPGLDPALAWGWGLASTAGLAWFGISLLRLHRSLDDLPSRSVGGVSVHLTAEDGPACWTTPGGPARVLLPAWLRNLAPDLRRLAVEHEREHLRRGDSLLAAAGCLVVAAAPWNLPLWWQLHRLRRALEMDCDARVLGTGVDPRDYGRLLLAVGGRGSGSAWTALPLSERASRLEQRIRTMIDTPPPDRIFRAAAFGFLALAAGALACETSPPAPDADTSARVGSAERPQFVPYDVAPELQNPREVQARLQEVYPDSLESAGVGGTVILWMYVDTDGDVRKSRVQESSGHESLDRAARGVVEAMKFSPALQGEEPTDVWVQQRIQFRPGEQDPSEGDRTSAERSGAPQLLDRMAAIVEKATITVDGDTVTDARTLEELRPDEIERIEVVKSELRDSDVIHITTKRG